MAQGLAKDTPLPYNRVMEPRYLHPGHVVRPSIAAALAGMSIRSVYKWIKNGILINDNPPGKVAGVCVGGITTITGRAYTDQDLARAIEATRAHYEKVEARRKRK